MLTLEEGKLSSEIKQEILDEMKELRIERDELEQQVRKLDQEKIDKLENLRIELEKQVEWLDKERIKVIKEKDNLNRQITHFRSRKWLNTLKMVLVLGVIDLIVVPVLSALFIIPIAWIFISIGLITFFGVVVIVNYMSGTSPLDTGEIRKAVTVSFITVYFVFVPIVTFGSIRIPQDEPFKTIITNFTWIVGLIIAFYFGSRVIEEYVKSKNSD